MYDKKNPFEMRADWDRRIGNTGWPIILGACALWDVKMPETLSSAFSRSLREHPVLTAGAWAVTSAHLFGLLPDQVDPFKRTLKMIKRSA